MKHFALAGVSAEDRETLLRLVSAAASELREPWTLHDGSAPADLVIVDLDQFAGRVARVRAQEERAALAAIANEETEGGAGPHTAAVLRRPFSRGAVVGLFNGGASPCTSGKAQASDRPASAPAPAAANDPEAPDPRANFAAPRQPRRCTDFAALTRRGPLLIERANLPRLMLDPESGLFHVNAPLSRLEPYFLDPLADRECRPLSRSRLDEWRQMAPGRPLVQLHWMGALLRSNGCLGAHLDPGGTYRVQRWMSVYGEYRKQYRIATQMLRPARLHEIARKANAKMVDVFDVVNAYDAIGLLEWEPRRSRHAAPEASRADPPRRESGSTDKRKLLAAALLTR